MSVITEIDTELQKINQNHSALIEKNKELSKLIKKAKELREKINTMLDDVVLGDPDSPIGYTKDENGVYVFQEDTLEIIDRHLGQLQVFLPSLPSELFHIFRPKVLKEINKLQSVRSKFLKNHITETMLRTISNTNNISRMVTPISFKPLVEAFDTIGDSAKPGRGLDLSNISHKQAVYNSLSSGAILVGAFANAVKVIAYLSRSGTDPELSSYLSEYSRLHAKATELETKIAKTPNEAYLAELFEIQKLIAEKYTRAHRQMEIRKAKPVETSPLIADAYRFKLNIQGNNRNFDRLQY